MKQPLFPLLPLLAALSLVGCAAFDPPYSDIIDQRFNPWLGKTKDDRIRIAGPPERCAQLQDGEEACTWKSAGIDGSSVTRFVTVSSWLHHVVFIYDKTGVAKAWHYSGSWGERSNNNAGERMSPESSALLP